MVYLLNMVDLSMAMLNNQMVYDDETYIVMINTHMFFIIIHEISYMNVL